MLREVGGGHYVACHFPLGHAEAPPAAVNGAVGRPPPDPTVAPTGPSGAVAATHGTSRAASGTRLARDANAATRSSTPPPRSCASATRPR